MKENLVSRTALMAAYLRSFHSIHDTPKIFDDFLAHQLLTAEEHKSFQDYYLFLLKKINNELSSNGQVISLAKMMQAMTASSLILSRSRYTEDTLEKAVQYGVKQYVILGAGMDTFAFRRAEMLKQIAVFEVDHPDTQTFKRQRIAELGWECSPSLHFIPVDFTIDSLKEALFQSSFDPTALSFFSWLGVTYYLPQDVVFDTLRTIADITSAGSKVVFDYYDTDIFDHEKVHPLMKTAMENLKRHGEPIKTAFNATTLTTELANAGLHLCEQLDPNEIEERYFKKRSDQYHALGHAHFGCIMT
ncbi:methyltransferase (TIGR00027 family) [Hydrogenispora ethanolica]|uniref:S-adenosyl-L-methionine-dependent methyltransferase n=2 Tax=Hydrogenispora ethanolica TaxID=1082276 RepID=A0A4R1QMQ0_HYDET|nr:methyltransferase (TIGR00027 family) [Hydrogenispora ethanolica]